MGMVYAAQNLRVEKMVRAIKIIRPELSADVSFRQRFLQEAEFMEILQHPNIMRVENVTEENGALFMVMELLTGRTVDEHLQFHGRLPVSSVAHIMVQGLAGVAHAHQHAVFHRDLKPANLFITDAGKVKVLDFGIARHGDATGRITQSGQGIPGSPAYFAPEFVEGAAASAASDIYALGISLYELLTGDTPFKPGGGNDTQAAFSLVMQHVRDPLPDVRLVRDDVPQAWAGLLAKMTAKRAEHRPSATAVMEALAPYLPQGVTADAGKTTRIAPRSALAGTPARGVTGINASTPSHTMPLGMLRQTPVTAPPNATPQSLVPTSTPAVNVNTATPPTSQADLGRLTNLNFPNDRVLAELAEETEAMGDAAAAGMMSKRAKVMVVGGALLVVVALGGGVMFAGGGGKTTAVTPAPVEDVIPLSPPAVQPAPPPVQKPTPQPDVGSPPAQPAPQAVQRLPVPPGMVALQGGVLQLGRDPYGKGVALDVGHLEVTVAPFALGLTEVTTGDFKAFADATGARTPWPPSLKMVEQLAALPVVDITVDNAEKFCRWRYGAQGRLPTEAEWEWAARSGGTRRYPFGDVLKKECVNAFKGVGGILLPVGLRGCGATPEGIQDLAGNAAEWTSTDATAYPNATVKVGTEGLKVVRGGSFASTEADALTTTARQFVAGTSRFVGFRCAGNLLAR